MNKTIEDIRHNFTNTTVENWVEEQGFASLEEACAEWGSTYVFDELDAIVNFEPSDYELEADDYPSDDLGEDY